MGNFTKTLLSASSNGRNISVDVATPALIHTAHATALDEIWLWAASTSTITLQLTLYFGGLTSPDDVIEYNIPAGYGFWLLVDRRVLTAGCAVKAIATNTQVKINGYVNRYV
jgi:hypothetical protein